MSLNGVKSWWSSTSSSNLLMYVIVGLLVYSLMGSMVNTNKAQKLVEYNVRMVNKSYEAALETSDARVRRNTELLEYGRMLDETENRALLDIVIPDEYTDSL